MLKKGILCSLILLLYGSCCCYLFYHTETRKIEINKSKTLETAKKSYGWLTIPRIHLSQELFPLGNEHNNIEEHVTILKREKPKKNSPSKIVLAAHSGDAPNSYFNELETLRQNDILQLKIEENQTEYQVVQTYLEPKTGVIHLKHSQNDILILTTCSVKQKGKQFILIAQKIEE